jgi:PST family polysaccharide transporter
VTVSWVCRLPRPVRGGAGALRTDPGHPAEKHELSGKVGRGLGWSFFNNVVSRLGTVLSGIVLARLLAPADFGMFAVALVVLNAGLSMNELGVSLAVVRWPDGIERIAPTVTSLALMWSSLLYVGCFVAAPGIASALHAQGSAPLIRVLSLCILLDAAASVSAALITRAFMQQTRMAIDMVSFVGGTSTSVVLAIAGAGPWCIVWGFLVSSTLSSILALAWSPGRYRPGFDLEAARSLLAFGLPLAGSSVLLFLMVNVDYIVVGRIVGGEGLGYYLLAFNLCSWPVTLISVAVRRVSLAGFSRIADEPARAGAAFVRAAGLIMAVTLPLCALLAAYAPAIITSLYGDRWSASASALRFLCVLGAARVGAELAYDFLVAVGRTRVNFAVQVLWLLVLVPALIIGARSGGIVGVALGHALVAALVILPAYALLLRGSLVGLRDLLRESLRPVLAAALVVATGILVPFAIDSPFWQLAVGGPAAGVLAVVVLAKVLRQARAALAGNAAGPVLPGVAA